MLLQPGTDIHWANKERKLSTDQLAEDVINNFLDYYEKVYE
jgi:hypothetical protein